MNKNIIVSALFVCFTYFLSAQLISNGSFESDWSGWETELINAANATFDIITENSSHSGKKMLKVNVAYRGRPANSVRLTCHAIETSKDRIYMVRFWAKAAQNDSRMVVTLAGENTNTQCEFRIDESFDSWKNGWQMYQYLFTTIDSKLDMVVTFNTNGVYYIDDFEIIDDTHQVLDLKTQIMWQNKLQGYGWVSGDNDVSVVLPDDRVAWIFSDSFLGNPKPNENYLRASTMINNLIVIEDEEGNLTSHYQGTSTAPRTLVPAPSGSVYWVGDGIVENDKLKVMYNEWRGLEFYNRAGVAVFSLPDLKREKTVIPAYTGSDIPNALLQDGDYIYIYTEERPGGFTRYTRVARVPAGELDSHSTPWEFYTQQGTWDTDPSKALRIVSAPGCSVRKLGEGNYVMSGVPNLSNEFALWFSTTPWGPWGNKTVIYNMPSEEGVLFYLGHIHDRPESAQTGVYTLSYSLYPFGGYVPQQLADKGTYLPVYLKANLRTLSPYTTESAVAQTRNDKQVRLFPNPVIHTLNIAGADQFEAVQIFDIAGTLIAEENHEIINMSDLDSGLYISKIICKNTTEEHIIIKR